MRIALDGEPLRAPLAGVGHYVRELVRALAAASPETRFSVVAPLPVRALARPALAHRFEAPNVDVVVPSWLETTLSRLSRTLGGAGELGRGLAPRCDVFHATNNVFAFRVRAARTVLTVHDLTVLLHPEWHPRERVALMAARLVPSIRAADHVIVPSESAKADVVRASGLDASRVTVIPQGVEPRFAPQPAESVRAALARLGLEPDRYLLFLGTLEPRKNLARLAEAVDRAGSDAGPLVVAGGEGWGGEPALVALRRLEAEGRVRLLGYVPDDLRPNLLAGARAFVYPSLYEGFGMPVLEAMACGAPVITSTASSLPEVAGEAAVLVDPEDVDALAGALRRVWGDEALRADLRARSLARARLFSWERTARETLDVYRRVLG